MPSDDKTSFDVTHEQQEIFAIRIKDHTEMMARDSYLGIAGSVGRCTSSTKIQRSANQGDSHLTSRLKGMVGRIRGT
jgi:hypothetical protein